jgi:hypothetical protein
MIEVRFSGWFQCRLATDPDPYDEPRGVSGYVHAYVGEPDLDRRIVFQRPAFVRRYSPPVGVFVDQVSTDNQPDPGHPLLGAAVNLLDAPCFEGRNGVIADDGLEPVYPFRLEFSKDGFRLVRGIAPQNPAFPFPELFAAGVEAAPDEIREATGIQDLLPQWRERRDELRAALNDAPEDERPGLAERLDFLEGQLQAGGGAGRFFFARMRYEYVLGSPLELEDPYGWLPAAASGDGPWPVRFWFGGWDADTLCGFARGTVTIDRPESVTSGTSRPARITDRRP